MPGGQEKSDSEKRTEERAETHERDTIYRQQAIDEIRKCRFVVDAIEKIRALPSAQSEIIRCKNCKHNHDCNIQYHAQAGEEFYCGVAERRIDEKNQN
jgi:hypothetical protein